MSKQKKRSVILTVLWAVGLLLLSLPVYSQSLWPGLGSDPSLKTWALMFMGGALFTLGLWIMKRIWEVMDRLASSVESLTRQSIKTREWRKVSDKEMDIHKTRLDFHWDKINKLTSAHAKCRVCPESNEI